ncbi:pheromone A receptor-domain-containing protein [Roridomyces roridus]|uniref:Pheromone A receptor-domain-containing protein n=1 Tax=Roridomyces roridus TaxID=1738132 RepID=A0AAD7C1V0_9AGAR|nr:pheromone A receptor-domain-containing protein [Roridomyces roridus]
MLPVLPILSFICAGLLAVFLIILLRRPTINTSNVSIVLWLLFGNIVHAVNALIWSSNVQLRVPIWCDIVTKLLLGINVALPGVCVCSARYIELLSSTRKLYPNTYSKRLHVLLDVALCYVLPLLYMTLHFTVQDHRFDLLQDFGCSASVHRSTTAVLIMVFPPLILCSISLGLCITSIHHFRRFSSARFALHLSARSALSPASFLRRLVKSTLFTAFVLVVTLFPLIPPRTQHWSSFSTERDLSVIFIIREPREVTGAEVVWCAIPSVSLVYLLLSAVLGDGVNDAVTCVRRRVTGGLKVPTRPARPELRLLTTFNNQPQMAAKSTLSLCTPSPAAQTVELRSGWDDMLDTKRPSPTRRGVMPLPYRKSIISASSSSEDGSSTAGPGTPPPKEEHDADEAFASSTMSYLASPVAVALGLASPVSASTPIVVSPASPVKTRTPSPPAAVYSRAPSPAASTFKASPRTTSPSTPTSTTARTPTPPVVAPVPPAPTHIRPRPVPLSLGMSMSTHLHPPQQPIPEDTASTISSIWDVPWPLPPARAPPRTTSRHASEAYPMYSPVEHRTSSPFEDAAGPPSPSPHRTQVPRKSAMKKSSRAPVAADVIYMTRTVEAHS